MTATLSQTPLCGWHEAHGGRMVDFAGWRMPVQYASIVDEHLATRTAAGLFDVSHMGRLAVSGAGSRDWLEHLLTRRVSDLEVGRVRYTLVTSATPDDAGAPTVLDDALVARDTDAPDGTPRFGLVVNASNRERVVTWLRQRLPAAGVLLEDRTTATAMIAVQGPRAIDIVTALCSADDAATIRSLRNYRAAAATVAGTAAAVSRTGYTGEDGVELVVPAPAAVAVWEAVERTGRDRGLRACGLGARDTLRLEAGMPLYGHELTAASDPFAIGLGLAIDLDGRTFPGSAAFAARRERPTGRVRVGLAGDSKRAPREGSVVRTPGGTDAGIVTSGSFSPTLGHAIAMALVDRSVAALDTPLEAVVRDSVLPVRVVPLPFYRRPSGPH